MGMYDDVHFDYRMPDGYEDGSFQTKDLSLDCSEYEITSGGRLLRAGEDQNYHGEFEMYYDDLFDDRSGHFRMIFNEGTLTLIICKGGERYVFTPEADPNLLALPPESVNATCNYKPTYEQREILRPLDEMPPLSSEVLAIMREMRK